MIYSHIKQNPTVGACSNLLKLHYRQRSTDNKPRIYLFKKKSFIHSFHKIVTKIIFIESFIRILYFQDRYIFLHLKQNCEHQKKWVTKLIPQDLILNLKQIVLTLPEMRKNSFSQTRTEPPSERDLSNKKIMKIGAFVQYLKILHKRKKSIQMNSINAFAGSRLKFSQKIPGAFVTIFMRRKRLNNILNFILLINLMFFQFFLQFKRCTKSF